MQDIGRFRVVNVVAVQNYGRSGSTFLQSLLDGHPNILSTPNFYSRAFYQKWDEKIADVPDGDKLQAFIDAFPPWFDTALVDHSAGLHRLGPDQNQVAHVDKDRFATLLASFFEGHEMTRANLLFGAHLAYGLCLDRDLARDLWILFPIHGRPKPIADALLEDFPDTKFIYTLREPVSNFASSLSYFRTSNADYASNPITSALGLQYCRKGNGSKELCLERPYRKAHRATGQAKAVRLEDLHARPEPVMRSLARWLDLPWHDCLLDSTFDCKTWWNRPESPKQSGFGGQMLNRNVQRRLSALDRFRVATIARPKALAWNYDTGESGRLTDLWHAALFALTLWVPWREERRHAPSPYRVVRWLTKYRRLLPVLLRDRIDDQMTREERRYWYLAFDRGVRGVRSTRPDGDKSQWIQCMIVLYPDPEDDGYKGKIYEDFPVPQDRQNRDYAVVRFADELAGRPDRREPWSSLRVVLGLGRLALIIRDYLMIRYLTARAYCQVRWEQGREVDLLEIEGRSSTPLIGPSPQPKIEAPAPSDKLSAA